MVKAVKESRRVKLLGLSKQFKFIKEFCDAAGISPSQFSQIKRGPKCIGNRLARRLEQNLNLSNGYLDTLPEARDAGAKSPVDVTEALEALPPPIKDLIEELIYALDKRLNTDPIEDEGGEDG